MKTVRSVRVLAAMLGFAFMAQPAAAQEPFTWENATELSFVSAAGNASSSTLGLKSTLGGSDGSNALKFEIGGIRGETGFRTITATGTADNFTVNETTTDELTAENYFARSRYDRSFGTVYTFGGLGWDRNTFAGIQNRYAFVAGSGKAWTDTDASRFKTDLGLTYTIQKDVDPVPGADDAFGGLRLSVDAMKQLSESTQFTSLLVMDENLEDTSDFRADWLNSLSVGLSSQLALKTSLQLLFDNQPSFLGVPLFDVGGTPLGTEVLTPGDEVDSIFTLALVITL